jgi:UDP-N-acetylglucosamine acyltransferase
MAVHPTAIVHPESEIDPTADIGPWVYIEKNVRIGAGTRLYPRVFVGENTTIGRDCIIHPNAVVGHISQDRKFKGEQTFLVLGDRNVVREFANLHRASIPGNSTLIGDDNLIMACAHVAHDCIIGNHVTISNCSLVAGHVRVEDAVTISGGVAIHQFVRLGSLAMIGGNARVTMDVPPYMLLEGNSTIRAINRIGLQRAGFSTEVQAAIKSAYKTFYRSGLPMTHALELIDRDAAAPEVRRFVDFVKGASQRGISKHARVRRATREDDGD